MTPNGARGRKRRSAHIVSFRGSAGYVHLGHLARKKAVSQSGQAQHGNNCDPYNNVATCPGGGLSVVRTAISAVDAQTLQVFMFSVNRHKNEYELCSASVSRTAN